MATGNIWDQAGRYAIRLDPAAFYEWTLHLPRQGQFFVGWADTRNVPFPLDPDRTRDTVARMQNLDEHGEPWAVITEVQSEPDPLILGRVNVYSGSFWIEQKPDKERGSRYFVAALVIYLTGRAVDMPTKIWQRCGLQSLTAPKQFHIAEQNAKEILDRIESGDLGLGVLPWIPLLQNADYEGIIEQWKNLGQMENDRRKKADYASLAIIFAEKIGQSAVWKEALKEWNMEESTVLKEWTKEAEERGKELGIKLGEELGIKLGEERGTAKGERKGILDSLAIFLKIQFGADGEEFAAELRQVPDLEKLRAIQQALITCKTIDELRTLMK